ncbi:MAG: 1-(5-phosphoribosyl)-5-amino-4-imidazole-carboxylate carboxylase [Dethiosulfovibrio peptidovorans]|nr:MAG: 1-(5-phosphoribosyl)-5-amino-4-imidazole-carboxylate carboxylase [Dethiosulfovibrio peptidovorans]
MDAKELLRLAQSLKTGELSPKDFVDKIKIEPFQDLGDVKFDHHRLLRRGIAEIVYCPGKSDAQLESIAEALTERQGTFLFSRIREEQVELLAKLLPDIRYHPRGSLAALVREEEDDASSVGVTVVAAGSSDIPVAEEAALTAEYLNCTVTRLYDIGVAGVHRLLAHVETLMASRVIIAVAGMEGALPSVVAGLVSCPVIAVPTSVGYGANFGGLSALLTMINSCATGVVVVNIDNGLGAGCTAAMIARQSQ